MATLRDSGDLSLVSRIAALQDKTSFKELHWEGTFEDYLLIVRENPRVTRTAFQRIYDMILSHGKTEYIDNKKRLIRYHFFHDEPNGGRDAVYGLDVPLMKLVDVFKSAAQGYGTEKRVILLHGPVGTSKSTSSRICSTGAAVRPARRRARSASRRPRRETSATEPSWVARRAMRSA